MLPAYNDERWLPYAIESTLAQTQRAFELLLINDGSSDGTLALMNAYAKRDPRIRVLSHENYGVARTLNEALHAARTDWVMRMDADDVMAPNRIERQLAFLEQHPEAAVIACLPIYINEAGDEIGRKARARFTAPGVALRASERGEVIQILHSGALIRRHAVLGVGGYRAEFDKVEDIELWGRLVDAGHEVLEQPEYLVHYRFRRASVSGGDYALQQRQLRWVAYCAAQRRVGLPEPSFQQFHALERSGSRLRTLNLSRKDFANDRFHRALWTYANGSRWRAANDVLVSSILDPTRALQRIGPKVLSTLRS